MPELGALDRACFRLPGSDRGPQIRSPSGISEAAFGHGNYFPKLLGVRRRPLRRFSLLTPPFRRLSYNLSHFPWLWLPAPGSAPMKSCP
jgi:hypothetical protein